MKSRAICIYHKGCADGFTGAWVVRKALKNWDIEFFGGVYGEDPPDVVGRKVIMVDFSYKREVMERIVSEAEYVDVFDHHATAEKELAGMTAANLCVEFDQNRSGARIVWDEYFAAPPPEVLLRVEDRDLWRFKLGDTREVMAYVSAIPYEFEEWDVLMEEKTAMEWIEICATGAAFIARDEKILTEILETMTRKIKIGGYLVPAVNVPKQMCSDAAHRLCQGQPFAVSYYDRPGKRVFELRSDDGGIDVSWVAAGYGGGGHPHAAGFTVPILETSPFETT